MFRGISSQLESNDGPIQNFSILILQWNHPNQLNKHQHTQLHTHVELLKCKVAPPLQTSYNMANKQPSRKYGQIPIISITGHYVQELHRGNPLAAGDQQKETKYTQQNLKHLDDKIS